MCRKKFFLISKRLCTRSSVVVQALAARAVASRSRPRAARTPYPRARALLTTQSPLTPKRCTAHQLHSRILSYSSPAHASQAAVLGEFDLRGVRVKCVSSRRVRPGLRDHRIDLADMPRTYRLRWSGDEERGGVSDLYADARGAERPPRSSTPTEATFSRCGRAGARCHPARGRTRPSRAPTSAAQ